MHDKVLIIAFTMALLSSFLIPFSLSHIRFIDVKVIILLFSLMAVVAGLWDTGIFTHISYYLINKAGSVRLLSLILIMICFFISMFVTNDVSLIMIVPLTITIFQVLNKKTLIYVIVLETAAANLGSMATPFGNPQNLYLYSFYQMSYMSFFRVVLPYVVLSLLIMVMLTLFIKDDAINVVFKGELKEIEKKNVILFSLLFMMCVLTVFGVINYYICLLSVLIIILIFNRSVLKKVDYGLLLTFMCFFIFVGNLNEISFIRTLLTQLINKNVLFSSIITSQVISNVPGAVMLSKFTGNSDLLLIGVNIGGLGTLIASLASLISFKFYIKTANSDIKKYIIVFSLVNFSILILLLTFYYCSLLSI
ncbi:MAG: citrate transporter [Clostridia bacterium]|nr:citrate transporter [Clostridia bacterium]